MAAAPVDGGGARAVSLSRFAPLMRYIANPTPMSKSSKPAAAPLARYAAWKRAGDLIFL